MTTQSKLTPKGSVLFFFKTPWGYPQIELSLKKPSKKNYFSLKRKEFAIKKFQFLVGLSKYKHKKNKNEKV